MNRFWPLTAGAILCLLSWTTWAQVKPKSKVDTWAQVKPKSKMIAEINGYTSWTEVTQRPVEMDPRVAMLCRSLLPSERKRTTTIRGTQGPHAKKYIRVYVNDIAKSQMMTRKNPHFPVGSVIVKQKLPLEKSQGKSQKISLKPELLTVMIKREAGYDEENGDWEYLVTDGTGKQTSERGQLESCQNCHRPFQKTDYLVRSYLPREVMSALRDTDAASARPQTKPQKDGR
jgi:hypothetical protein